MADKNFNSRTLRKHVPLPVDLDAIISAAANHALSTEGSFARANLALGVGLSLGLDLSSAEKVGASVELFHLASLLLDDLPCMDDADIRRSKECTHVMFGQSSTILTALGFINRGYFLLWEVYASAAQARQREAADLVDRCLGFAGILDGQSKDINFTQTIDGASRISEIANKKTGSLFHMCVMLPAILAGVDRYRKMHLVQLSSKWGLAYQIADDLKDLFQGENVSGKTAQRDAIMGRPNMAIAIGEERAASMLRDLLEEANRSIVAVSCDSKDLESALTSVQSRLSSAAAPLISLYVAA